ncbi:GNAT family N-acetyltransferase [Pseudomonas vancouverensis]|uniref:GNAT family N-acetyltransferase n=1 Tax=Pseudomonas vancouverensis TaxID=95300 RepID=A0A1H2NPW5_PSEVA|nr:GNAT family N-acetyltransferase [Pseudomonas vancouverensis]KAB0491275.1 GNAT family N-acetyltransferase [Pseudomonas vancouverensis]TDB64308.1 GNAT family N-acetyltransferase [Pseudomonas vancouverensis]SDV07440.1 N-acetylglutamate synthase, GNAT family [Pseudomonas vancouverensis]
MQGFIIRSAQPGDGQAVFDVTRQSIAELSNGLYSPQQLSGWMGERTADFYEQLIHRGQMVVALLAGRIVGFVDAEPGEVTRLFLLREASGHGLGAHLLGIGLEKARGPGIQTIRVESTLNAEGFYQRHGFVTRERGFFSHGLGGEPIAIIHMERHEDVQDEPHPACLPDGEL